MEPTNNPTRAPEDRLDRLFALAQTMVPTPLKFGPGDDWAVSERGALPEAQAHAATDALSSAGFQARVISEATGGCLVQVLINCDLGFPPSRGAPASV